MTSPATSFHASLESALENLATTIQLPRKVQRTASWSFDPHFHPYVQELVRRLNADGADGLAAASVDYGTPVDGMLPTLPDSTKAILSIDTPAVRTSDQTSIPLRAGTALTLLDETQIVLSDLSVVKLPGLVPALASGTQVTIGGNVTRLLPDREPVTLQAASQALLSDGTAVTLPGGVVLALRGGTPQPLLYGPIFSSTAYAPSGLVQQPWPVRDLDMRANGAYAPYNWELFFHVTLLCASQLSQAGQYQAAQQCYHRIFDPTDNSDGPTPQRFWKVEPFRSTDTTQIDQLLTNLATGADPGLQRETLLSVNAWIDDPFDPFIIARFRPTALMLKTVMAYLDNLVAWGDSLFQQYTVETLNEATELYMLAADILGPRPQAVPPKGTIAPASYQDLRNSAGGLDAFSNTLRDLEVDIPFDIVPAPAGVLNDGGAASVASTASTLFFCVPPNTQLLAYWDTIAGRLFNLHNCLTLDGVFQQPALYDPPIDPALLVRAKAEGLDVAAIVAGLDQPMPLVRFQLLVAKALEIAQDVRALGASLLAALEKNDTEALALLHAQNDTALLEKNEMVRYAQWQDAIKAREGLEQSLANAVDRYTYYQKLLGLTTGSPTIPAMDSLDADGLSQLSFANEEPALALQSIKVDISTQSTSLSEGAVRTLSSREATELTHNQLAQKLQMAASAEDALSSALALIPQFEANASPIGVGASTGFGGVQLSHVMSSIASTSRLQSEIESAIAGMAGKLGGYVRREEEWTNQSNATAGEINLIFKQLRGAQIREAIAQREYESHQLQMQQAQSVLDFLKGKDTNQGLYLWMKGALRTTYNRMFQLGFEVARKAERALQREIGDPSQSFVQAGYMDGPQGLLAGEGLYADVKRMEMSYHDLNQRERDMFCSISLMEVAPLALLKLRAQGSCQVQLTEDMFAAGAPDQFFLRIRRAALSIPCVTGPYVAVNCTMQLVGSSIRTSSSLPAVANAGKSPYARSGADDARFSDNFSMLESIVTSSARSDSGVAETGDARYLPFELSGAVSTWQLSLPMDFLPFDPRTISDAIIELHYTARSGGDPFGAAAVDYRRSLVKTGSASGCVRLFSIRRDCPDAWALFQAAPAGTLAPLTLEFPATLYPYWAHVLDDNGKPTIKLLSLSLYADMTSGDVASVGVYQTPVVANQPDAAKLVATDYAPLLSGSLAKSIVLPSAVTDASGPGLTLYFDNTAMEDLWVAVSWAG